MTSRQKNKQPKVTPEFLEALGTVLGEFANVAFEPRCEHYRNVGTEFADELEAATHLLADWYRDATGETIWWFGDPRDETDERARERRRVAVTFI
jgi:hypothetical protein